MIGLSIMYISVGTGAGERHKAQSFPAVSWAKYSLGDLMHQTPQTHRHSDPSIMISTLDRLSQTTSLFHSNEFL